MSTLSVSQESVTLNSAIVNTKQDHDAHAHHDTSSNTTFWFLALLNDRLPIVCLVFCYLRGVVYEHRWRRIG